MSSGNTSPEERKKTEGSRQPHHLLSPIYAINQESEDSEAIFSKELTITSPATKRSRRRDTPRERKSMFENEPLVSACFPEIPFSRQALLSFVNNQHNKKNINVAEANIKLGRQYIKNKKRVSPLSTPKAPRTEDKFTNKLRHADTKATEMTSTMGKIQTKLEDDLGPFKKTMEELDSKFADIQNVETKYRESQQELENLRQSVKENEALKADNSERMISETQNKLSLLEQKVLQYKQKVQEIKEMKQRLERINEESSKKDEEIERAQEALKEAKKKIVIASDSEGVVRHFRVLTQKNKELEQELDFYTNHKDSLLTAYDTVAKRNKLIEEAGLKFLSALKTYRRKTMSTVSTDDTCVKGEQSGDTVALQQCVEQFEALLKGEGKHIV